MGVSTFRLRVLGGFALEGPSGAQVPPLPQRRAKAVLAVLVLCGDLGSTRERLLALLWPESDEAHSRQGLRDALLAIRHTLGPGAVRSVGDLVRLDPTVVGSDVRSFLQALGSGQHADAVRAYGGSLLEGFHVDDAPEFERWLDGERTRLTREYGEALERLATAAERAGAWEEAVAWWGRAVEHDPLNSHLVLQHVQALAAIGDRANAIRAADVHTRRLRAELDLEPDREVLAKIERLRRGELPPPRDGVPRLPPGAPADRFNAVALFAKAQAGREVAAAPASVAVVSRPFRRRALISVGAVVVVGGALLLLHFGRAPRAPAGPAYGRTAIAVLPFQNLSGEGPHAYFAGGLHDELLTQLSKVASLKVISRTSVMGYQGTTKPLRQIAAELGVGSVVEGTVQIDGGRLRVTVELIDAGTDAHLWAERYDRRLDDAFAIQSDVAQQIVAAVGVALSGAERHELADAPTSNAEAYRLYLQGGEYLTRPGAPRKNWAIAQQLFERALTLDPGFALAHAGLSQVHGRMYWQRFDPSPARAARQREEAEAALRLAPSLPQAHVAMGLAHYWGRRDYRRALEEFGIALKGLPNDSKLWLWIGAVHRRLGNWNEVLAAFEKVTQLAPRDPILFAELGDTYHVLHRYAEAVRASDRAVSLAPDLYGAAIAKGWAYVRWQGQLDTLRVVLGGVPKDADLTPKGSTAAQHVQLLHWERHTDSLLQVLTMSRGEVFEGLGFFLPASLYAGWAHQLRGDRPAAGAAFDSARVLLDSVMRGLPDDGRVHAARGLALAGLGARAAALREARWLEQSVVYREDAMAGPELAEDRARILAQAGDAEAALDEVERLLARPSWLSVHTLQLDPRWDPIRDHPRFRALLSKYAAR